jgi:hypothetical protein
MACSPKRVIWRRRHLQRIAISAALFAVLLITTPATAAPTFVSKWGGSVGGADGQLNVPLGMATDPSGNLYVADSSNNRIVKYSADGIFLRTWGTGVDDGSVAAQICTAGCEQGDISNLQGGFAGPRGVAVNGGSVYVTDRNNDRVQQFDLDGTFVRAWGDNGPTGTEFNHPSGIAVDSNGDLYVTDFDNRRVSKFDSTGGFIVTFGWGVDTGTAAFETCAIAANCQAGVSGTNVGQFTLPEAVTTDSAGNVYVADGGTSGGPVQKLASSGSTVTPVIKWGAAGTGGEGFFNQLRGIGLSPTTGNLLVVDQNNRRIQQFDTNGVFQQMFGWDVVPGGGTGYEVCASNCKAGLFGDGDGQFSAAYGIAFSPRGGIYVSDTGNARIQCFGEQPSDCVQQAQQPAIQATQAPESQPSQTPAAPVLGLRVNVSVVKGRVLIAVPVTSAGRGSARASQKGLKFVPLTAARQIPVGSFLNTRKGTVRLRSARNSAGATQTGDFSSGLFQVLQSRKKRAKGLTDLVLKGANFRSCKPRRGKRAQTALSKRALRRLRANAKGRFRTRGRYSAATVRGTVWTTTDRCDGTLTKVTRGRVAVRDFRRKRTILVKRGKSYFAKAPN